MPERSVPSIVSVQRKSRIAWLVAVGVHLAVICIAAASLAVHATQEADAASPGVRSIVRLSPAVLGGIRVAELSGLAWDAEDQVLYGISDRGYLYRFRLKLQNRHLTAVEPMDAVRLRWPAHTQDRPASIDAEGLAILRGNNGVVGDAQLLVSTEGQPQVLRVTTGGQVLGLLTVPEPLSDAGHYQAENAMLEALAHSEEHGLLTAAEAPLAGQRPGIHQVHTIGNSWAFPMLDSARSRLKAMEILPDGSLVVLERARAGKGKSLTNALRRIQLGDCGDEVICSVQDLLVIDKTEGAENFEGMAYLGDMLFLLVSDNLGSKQTPSVFLLVDLKTLDRE